MSWLTDLGTMFAVSVCLVVASGAVLLVTLIVALFSPAGETELNTRTNPLVHPLVWTARILFVTGFIGSIFWGPELYRRTAMLIGLTWVATRRRIRKLEERV
jgi:NADH:ubiquinone oxidoreductase subunit 6 (subunit J)